MKWLFLVLLFAIVGCSIFPARQSKPIITPENIGNVAGIAKEVNWLMAVLVIGFVAGIILACWLRAVGGAVCVGCLAGIVLTLSVALWAKWIAVIGMLALFGGGCYYFYLQITRQLIQTAEAAKQQLPDAKKLQIFGNDGIADRIQNKTTKRIVNLIRKG